MYDVPRPLTLLLAFALALPLFTGCGPSHRLGDYDFDDRTVAVMAAIPPAPRISGNGWGEAYVDPGDPIGTAVRIGTATAKWDQARKAQVRLDSAAARVDIAEIVAVRALRGSAPALRLQPVDRPDDADFVLDIRVYDYGLAADSYDGALFFALEAEVVLLDEATRETVWKQTLREREVLSSTIFGLPPAAGNVVTARALSRLSVEEMEAGLARLAAFAADRVTGALRKDFLESRAKRS